MLYTEKLTDKDKVGIYLYFDYVMLCQYENVTNSVQPEIS